MCFDRFRSALRNSPVMVASHEAAGGPGVEPVRPASDSRRWLPLVEGLALDARIALGWAGRGHLVTSPYLPLLVRRGLLRLAGVEIGAAVGGLIACTFASRNVTIGAGSYVGLHACFEGAGRIIIGEDCMLGPEVMIVTSNHPRSANGTIARAVEYLEVDVGSRCWLGARTTLLPGVHIGEGTIVAAGAVVTENCEAGAVYAGVPARKVR